MKAHASNGCYKQCADAVSGLFGKVNSDPNDPHRRAYAQTSADADGAGVARRR
jgi:hypothetical protein